MAKKGFMDYKTYDTSQGFGNANKWKGAFEERMNLRKNTDEENALVSQTQTLYECNSFESLRSEYRRLMHLYHPDHTADTVENKIIAQAINDLYWKLKKSKFDIDN